MSFYEFDKPNNRAVIFICGFIFIVTSSCNLFNNDQKGVTYKEDVYDGIYIQGFEDSWFEPCIAVDESWKPIFTGTTFDSLSEGSEEGLFGKPYVRARGIPSKKGEYQGWHALYDREFEIKEIVEVRRSKSGKCP